MVRLLLLCPPGPTFLPWGERDQPQYCLQDRLDQQRREAETNPEYGSTFKGQLSKEEKQAKRKQIVATIGESAADATAILLRLLSTLQQ